jgi:hypothetical protein
VKAFLSELAVKGRVSKSTQRQALLPSCGARSVPAAAGAVRAQA